VLETNNQPNTHGNAHKAKQKTDDSNSSIGKDTGHGYFSSQRFDIAMC
jgi:hypothetical protein